MSMQYLHRALTLFAMTILIVSCGDSPTDPDDDGPPAANYEVAIEHSWGSVQGQHEHIAVSLTEADANIMGFSIRLGYDAEALLFQAAYEGTTLYEDCGWEYFTYRYGDTVGCGDLCPSGIIRVIGLAEVDAPPVSLECPDIESLPVTLLSLDFVVADDYHYECTFVPIRFLWLKCSDNVLVPSDGRYLGCSRKVLDFDDGSLDYVEIQDATVGYPTYAGAQDEDCLSAPYADSVRRCVDFLNGGVDIMCPEALEVAIERTHNTYQGMHEEVDVTITSGSELMGGFDVLAGYDASALSLVTVLEGDLYGAPCNWEYFTYRYGPFGNCGNACPSGMVRVVGIAETNNGDNHPDCFGPDGLTHPFKLFTFDFLVTDDRTFECMFVPIRFFWFDCGDNSIATKMGDTLFISDRVIDRFLIDDPRDITDPHYGYPTYFGAQDEDCFSGDPNKVPLRRTRFINGGIDIICADSIDSRGDINLNQIPYEIADAILFADYFLYGLDVFQVNVQGQIAATDVNADGLTLSLPDLVYLIRVIIGDAVPYDKLTPITAQWTVNNGIISIDSTVGACHLVVAGEVTPALLANNMDIRYHFDGINTKVLVYSMEGGETFEGYFIHCPGEVLEIEFATYEGALVMAGRVN